MLFSVEFFAIFGPFCVHVWTNFQVKSLSLCLPDFLNIFSRPVVGHFWTCLDHSVINFRQSNVASSGLVKTRVSAFERVGSASDGAVVAVESRLGSTVASARSTNDPALIQRLRPR